MVGDYGDFSSFNDPRSGRYIQQCVSDLVGVQNHEICLLADSDTVVACNSDCASGIFRAHIQDGCLMLRRAELNDVRQHVANDQHVRLAERGKGVAYVVGRIGYVDSRVAKRSDGSYAAALVLFIFSPEGRITRRFTTDDFQARATTSIRHDKA